FRLLKETVRTKREWPEQFFGLADPIVSRDDDRYSSGIILSAVESLAGALRREGAHLPGRSARWTILRPEDISSVDYRTRYCTATPMLVGIAALSLLRLAHLRGIRKRLNFAQIAWRLISITLIERYRAW